MIVILNKVKFYGLNLGLKFYTFSDKYSSALLGYSVLGFYISIIYLIGNLFRTTFTGKIEMTFIDENPYPEDLISLVEAI